MSRQPKAFPANRSRPEKAPKARRRTRESLTATLSQNADRIGGPIFAAALDMRERGTRRLGGQEPAKSHHGREAAGLFAAVWAIVDSNHGPPPYQSGALTN